MGHRTLRFVGAGLVLLAGCTKTPSAPPEVRPVRLLTVAPQPVSLNNVYAGEVRPRFSSNLGFRVSGKIAQRLVNLGDEVRAGQVLARLDPKDLALNQASAQAQVAAQAAQFAVEKADLARYRQLLTQGFVSKAEVDRQQTRSDAARAQLTAAEAQARVTANATRYAELHADHDGSITAVDAEAGQVVSAGQTVFGLAWSGEIEVQADLPEQFVHTVHEGDPVEIHLWAVPGRTFAGRVREIASSADPATRTYSVRVSLRPVPPEMRLGMTANLRFQGPPVPSMIRVPLTALVEQRSKAGVWVFDDKAGVVHFRAVQAAGVNDNQILIAAGLATGERVATAGARLLHEGQRVRPLDALPAP